MKTKLIKFHFIILLTLIVNIFVTNTFDFGVNSYAIISLMVLLFGSGISIFVLNFKRLLKPFTLLKVYSTFYITIPLLVLFICNIDDSCSNSTAYRFEKSLSRATPIYRQYNYEIYEKTGVLDYIRTCSGSAENYYIDRNYFIFKIRLGYFYFGNEYGEFIFPKPLKEDIKNIDVKNDSVYIDFNDGNTRVFKIEK